MKPTPKPLTLGEIAEYLHVNRVTVQRWVKDALMPAYRTPGGHYRVAKQDFRRFLKQNGQPIYSEFFQDVPHRIIIADSPVEDSIILVNTLNDSDGDYELRTCQSGRETLILLGQFQPDLIVLNIDIEDLGVPSVCADIKKMFTESQIHILALTQLHSPEAVLDAGADQCLRKPMAAEAFLGAIQEMMGASVMA